MKYVPEIMIGARRDQKTKKQIYVVLHDGRAIEFHAHIELMRFLEEATKEKQVH
jgi:hypothetical protein